MMEKRLLIREFSLFSALGWIKLLFPFPDFGIQNFVKIFINLASLNQLL